MRAALRRRRLLSTLVALGVAAAACSSDDATTRASAPSTSTTAGAGTEAGPGASTSTTSVAPQGGSPSSATGTGGPGASTTSTTVPAALIAVGALPVGGLGPPLLQAGRGDRIVVEVRAQAGAAPAPATLDHLAEVLADASGKAVAVSDVQALDGGARDWTARSILAAASGGAPTESGRAQVVLRVVFLRGTYEGDTGVLGVAVAGDVAAVLSDRVTAAAGILVSSSTVEDAVAVHEVGHLLGLVDLVRHTGRADPDHPGHSRNRRSVMYWQVESDLIGQLLDGGIPRDFDSDDLADLAAIRAG